MHKPHTRFGVIGEETGAIWSRTGAHFSDQVTTEAILERLRQAVDRTAAG